jgi:hypothetical protein
MILVLSCFITNNRISSENRYDRLDVFKYTLKSYKILPFEELFFFILLDGTFIQRKDELEKFIYSTFNNIDVSKIHLEFNRYTTQNEWTPFFIELNKKYEENELIWFIQNDDHVFIDFNVDILTEGLDLLKKEKNNFKSLYFSHWPEILKLSGKYETPALIGNYIKFNMSLLDSIQIFNLKYLNFIFLEYKWKANHHIRIDSILNELVNLPAEENTLNQVIYVPLREMVRHFDGYSHVHMDSKACPPLIYPENKFEYSREILRSKMTANHYSPWTKNNYFNIPEEWININFSLHPTDLKLYIIN